jgi:alkylhydroperoxidase/carboxymuconolactone decarboxylase family protein YurZ
MTTLHPDDDSAAVAAQARLAAVRAKRGYLLPHHGLLAVAAPDLLDAYDQAYTALALTPRRLTAHDKEFVWLAVLVATDEAIATHHIRKFRDAGGTADEIQAALRLAAVARAAPAFAFVDEHWAAAIPEFAREDAYRGAIADALGPFLLPPRLAEMTLAAVQTCRAAWWEVGVHIRAAYAAKVVEEELAEAIAITMFPGSVPYFVEACGVWQKLIASGAVAASPAFRAWAAIDQGGFDAHAAAKP